MSMTAEEAGTKAGMIITAFLLAEQSSFKHNMVLAVGTMEETQTLTISLNEEGSSLTFLFNSKFSRLVASLWVNPKAPWNVNGWTERAEEYSQAFMTAADEFDKVAATGECRTPGMKLN